MRDRRLLRGAALLWITLAPCWVSPAWSDPALTQADLLMRLIDLDRLSLPPGAGERSLVFSSFDRRSLEVESGRYAHWDANDDFGNFLSLTADGWDVLAEVKGPGYVTHFWSPDPTGKVRIEIDGKEVISTEFEKLFDGATQPFAEPLAYRSRPGGGWNLRFPIGFQESLRISSRDFKGHYQIDALALPTAAQVQSFRVELDEQAGQALQALTRAFRSGLSESQITLGRKASPQGGPEELAPGEKLVWDIEKAGTIRGLYVSTTDRAEPRRYALHKCVLRAFWDGETEPAIEAPLCEFFGAGFDRAAYRSLPMGTDWWSDLPGVVPAESWQMYCYFPMPFQRSARLEIENQSDAKIGIMLLLKVDAAPPGAERLAFRARWRVDPAGKAFDYALLEAPGPGRIVGLTLDADCPRSDWWGEGDHKVWLEGEALPSIWGTGAADYFGDAAPLGLFSRPFHAVTTAGRFGKSSACRWHIADAISFEKSVRFAIENWQRDQRQDTFLGSVVYWYGRPANARLFPRVKAEQLALPGLRIPGAVEIEDNVLGENWGSVVKEKYVEDELSGGRAALVTSTEPVAIRIPVVKAGRARLGLRMAPSRAFETVRVLDESGKVIGTASWKRGGDGTYEIGEMEFLAPETRVRVECSKPAMLDCWVVSPGT